MLDDFTEGPTRWISAVDIFNATYRYLQKYNKFQHTHVDVLYEKYGRVDKVQYKNICTYIIFNNETKQYYIGSGDRVAREQVHFGLLRTNKHYNKRFQDAYNANIDFVVFSVSHQTRREALAFEQIMIDHFWGDDLFLNNARYVGSPTLGETYSEERRQQITERNLLMWQDPNHKQKVFTPDSSAKRSLSLKGNTFSLGMKHTEETKKKQKEASLAYYADPENKENHKARQIEGVKAMSQETRDHQRQKLSIAMTKRYEDPAARLKTSKAIKESWTPERSTRMSAVAKEYSNRPEIKEHRAASHIALWADPEFKTKTSLAIKQAQATPEYRAKRSLISKEYSNRPEVKEKRKETMKKFFEDPVYQQKNKERLVSLNAAVSKKVSIDGRVYISLREASRITGLSRAFIKKKFVS